MPWFFHWQNMRSLQEKGSIKVLSCYVKQLVWLLSLATVVHLTRIVHIQWWFSRYCGGIKYRKAGGAGLWRFPLCTGEQGCAGSKVKAHLSLSQHQAAEIKSNEKSWLRHCPGVAADGQGSVESCSLTELKGSFTVPALSSQPTKTPSSQSLVLHFPFPGALYSNL